MDLEQLRAKRNDIAAKMQKLAEAEASDEGMSEEQATEFDTLAAEFDKLDAKIRRIEKAAGVQDRLSALRPSVGHDQITGSQDGPRHPAGPEAAREFETFGEFMHAVRFNPNDQRLGEFQESEMKAGHEMGDGPSGGFAVPTQFIGELRQVDQAQAVVRPRAEVIPPGSPPDAKVSLVALDQGSAQNMYGGVSVSWIGEGDSKPEQNARLREVSLEPQEVAGHVVVTDKLLRNWQAAGTVLSNLIRKAINAAEDDKFINGDGVAKPRGFIGHGCELTVNRTTANTIKYADLADMEGEMLPQGMPVWLTTGKAIPHLRKMEDSEGHLIWTDGGRGDVAGGKPDLLLGKPVIKVPRMPSLGSKGDLCLVDLSHYLIKDGSGPFIAASEHVHFTNNKTVIKAFWNVDGQPWLTEPVTEENGEQFSPFVVLDVPSS